MVQQGMHGHPDPVGGLLGLYGEASGVARKQAAEIPKSKPAYLYLNALDQPIKRDLRCRAYLRYVDDFPSGVLVHTLLHTPVYTECPAFEHQLDALHVLQYRDIL
jgi:hypothetical protein